MKRAIVIIAISGLCFVAKAASADDVAKIQGIMNKSEFCKSLKVNTSTFRKLLPINIPDIIPDADIGVDKDFHTIKAFDTTPTTAKVTGAYGCRPSDEGVPFKAPFNQKPEDWQLNDNFECEAQIANKVVNSAKCTNSGEIGKVIAAGTNADEKMKSVIQTAIQ